jgi:hypothetical protein
MKKDQMTDEEKRKKRCEYQKRWASKTGYYRVSNMTPAQRQKARAKWRENNARWRSKNPEKHRAWSKRYAKNNPNKIKAQIERKKKSGAWRSEEYRKQRRAYREKHRERIRSYHREYQKRWIEKDENHHILMRLRWRLRDALRRDKAKKSTRTIELLGCDIEFFKWYMSERFTKGMTWQNYGKWHIDHIIPCAEFDLRDQLQQRQCFHYSNLQPLWSIDNMRKGARRAATATR